MNDEQTQLPTPEGPMANLTVLILVWSALGSLIYAAWLIGTPWAWIALAATTALIALFVEVRNLNNTLVRVLPALVAEAQGLRRLQRREP